MAAFNLATDYYYTSNLYISNLWFGFKDGGQVIVPGIYIQFTVSAWQYSGLTIKNAIYSENLHGSTAKREQNLLLQVDPQTCRITEFSGEML